MSILCKLHIQNNNLRLLMISYNFFTVTISASFTKFITVFSTMTEGFTNRYGSLSEIFLESGSEFPLVRQAY